MRHTSRKHTLSATKSSDKPPKLRFKPGSFVKDAKGQLYCIRIAYRLRDNPHEWIYSLEYRDSLEDPSTPSSRLCGQILGDQNALKECIVLWEPFYNSMDAHSHDATRDMYHYGDSKDIPSREMKQFALVSGGEICR